MSQYKKFDEDFKKILAIICYEKSRGQFQLDDLKSATGLNDDQIRLYGTRVGGVLEESGSADGVFYYSVRIEALALYLNHMILIETRQQSHRAYVMATLAVLVGLLAVAISVWTGRIH